MALVKRQTKGKCTSFVFKRRNWKEGRWLGFLGGWESKKTKLWQRIVWEWNQNDKRCKKTRFKNEWNQDKQKKGEFKMVELQLQMVQNAWIERHQHQHVLQGDDHYRGYRTAFE